MVMSPQEKKFLDEILETSGSLDSPVMFLLHRLQDRFRYIDREHAEYIAEKLGRPLAEIYFAATFYGEFTTGPVGTHVVKVCRGIVCHSRRSAEVLEAVRRELGMEDCGTTDDGLFTLEEASCIGQCDGGPAMMVDDKVFRNLDPSSAVSVIEGIRKGGE